MYKQGRHTFAQSKHTAWSLLTLLGYHYYYLYSSVPRHSKGISSLSNWLFPLCSKLGTNKQAQLSPTWRAVSWQSTLSAYVINDFLLATVHEDALIFPLMRTFSSPVPVGFAWAAVRGCFLFFQGAGHLQGPVYTFAPQLPYVGWKRALWLTVTNILFSKA